MAVVGPEWIRASLIPILNQRSSNENLSGYENGNDREIPRANAHCENENASGNARSLHNENAYVPKSPEWNADSSQSSERALMLDPAFRDPLKHDRTD